jgi:hypothetical protein
MLVVAIWGENIVEATRDEVTSWGVCIAAIVMVEMFALDI